MDNLFGPLSPSTSSRRTSTSSAEDCLISNNKTNSSSEITDAVGEVLAARQTCFSAESLSLPPISECVAYSSGIANTTVSSGDSGSLCCISASAIEIAAVIHDEQIVSFMLLNFVNDIFYCLKGIILITKCVVFTD